MCVCIYMFMYVYIHINLKQLGDERDCETFFFQRFFKRNLIFAMP